MAERTITSVTIYWDRQDLGNEGWAYRIEYRGGHEVSGPIDAITLQYAIESIISQYELPIAATDFAISSAEGGYAHWVNCE